MYVIKTGPGNYFQRRGCVLSTQSVLPTFYETKEDVLGEVQALQLINNFMQKKGMGSAPAEEYEIIKWEVG